ncbi:MAG TPA: cation diffusion facilitator family transporter [Candidatus Nitrosopolaris sp.]|nr:cation diffusion facilitator family transporter [Candidatus Nitrosopolaris sp.]
MVEQNDDHHNHDHQDEHEESASDLSVVAKTRQDAHKEKLKVAITSIAASAGLAIFKIIIGFSTNSLGILSEAFHSGLDVLAALMTLYAIRMVMRPPDLKYTYGYAKVESVSSLSEIILLFAVAGWIFYEGVERMLFKSIQPEITLFSFIIMFVSVGIDFGRSRILYRTARKYGSQALEADALHFKTDMITSFIVIVGLLFVFLFHIPKADAYAAVIVAGMIIYTSLGLGRRTLDVLLDKAPKGAYQRVLEAVSGLDGVDRAHDIRIRRMGSETFVDMHIEVPRTSTHDKAHKVATSVEEKVRGVLPASDVLVHVDATESASETITDRIRLVAAETDGIKNVHSIYLSKITPTSRSQESALEATSLDLDNNLSDLSGINRGSILHVYLDVQMNRDLDLKTAHGIIDSFEIKLKEVVPELRDITTHMETETSEYVSMGTEKKPAIAYLERIRNAALAIPGVVDCKDIGVVYVNDEQHITLSIKIKSTNEKVIKTIEDAHRLATNVQNLVIRQTGASRVIVHTEPG